MLLFRTYQTGSPICTLNWLINVDVTVLKILSQSSAQSFITDILICQERAAQDIRTGTMELPEWYFQVKQLCRWNSMAPNKKHTTTKALDNFQSMCTTNRTAVGKAVNPEAMLNRIEVPMGCSELMSMSLYCKLWFHLRQIPKRRRQALDDVVATCQSSNWQELAERLTYLILMNSIRKRIIAVNCAILGTSIIRRHISAGVQPPISPVPLEARHQAPNST